MTVVVESFVADDADTEVALAQLDAQFRACEIDPSLALVFYDPAHDAQAIGDYLWRRLPGVPISGGTSYQGVMSHHDGGRTASLGVMLISDPNGAYGVAAADMGTDPAGAAESAVHRALADADADGELPELMWIFQRPGREESILSGLRRVIGDRCPILGGSCAEDGAHGLGSQLSADGLMTNGLVVAVLFPSGGVGYSYQGGYEPTGRSGIVTEVGREPVHDHGVELDVSRHVLRIDDEPAATVYQRWLREESPDAPAEPGADIAAIAAAYPIAMRDKGDGELGYFRVIHPSRISDQQGLWTFAAVRRGARVFGMRGRSDRLIRRAGRVVTTARGSLDPEFPEIAGGIVAFCAGCCLIVRSDIDRVAETVTSAFGDSPFLGCFTSGEQGPILGRTVHANLMISTVVFGR